MATLLRGAPATPLRGAPATPLRADAPFARFYGADGPSARNAGGRGARGLRGWWGLAAGVLCLLAAGCGRVVEGQPAVPQRDRSDRSLIVEYFERSNAAARAGPAVQAEFLTRTQHPDVTRECDLGTLTVMLEPSLSTLRPHDGWRPARSNRTPRGKVYVIAVTVSVQRDDATLGTQVGSMHLVVLNGTAYGFAPCPT